MNWKSQVRQMYADLLLTCDAYPNAPQVCCGSCTARERPEGRVEGAAEMDRPIGEPDKRAGWKNTLNETVNESCLGGK